MFLCHKYTALKKYINFIIGLRAKSWTKPQFLYLPGRGSNSFLKRLQHGPAEVTRLRPGSVCFPSRSKCSIRHSFVSPGCNKTRHYATKRSMFSSDRSTTSNAIRNGHQQSFPVKSPTSEGTTESTKIQMPVTKTAKTSAQTVSSRRCNRNTVYYK